MSITIPLHRNQLGALDSKNYLGAEVITDGGNAALGLVAPSGVSQGSSISLLTDGTNPFGTGPTNVRYEDYGQAGVGVEVTAANTNFDSNNNFVKAIRDPDARSGAVSASTWQQHSENSWRSADVYIDFAACTELFVSYAIKVPSGSNFPSGGNTGTDADYPAVSAWKTSWILGPNSATNDLVTGTVVGTGWSHSGNDLGVLRNWGNTPTWWEWGAWNRLTTWVKAGATPQTDAGDLYFQVANTVDTIFEDSTTPVVFGSGTAPYEWSRWQPQGWQSNASTQGGVKTLYDCIYIATGANAAARVELGDNAVYSSCTDLHIQHVTPANWATGQLDFDIDYGPFSEGDSLWLHITREDNATRYSIQVPSSVSFGTSALGGTLTGDTLVLTTDGTYSFGTKAQAAPFIYDLVDTVYENGTADTSQSSLADGTQVAADLANPFYEQTGNEPAIQRSGLRHAGLTAHYKAINDTSWVGKPLAFKENTTSFGGYDRTPQTDKFYASWYFKPQYKVNSYGEVDITNVVGTFETKNGLFAEDLIITGATDVAYMKLIDVINSGTRIAFEATRGTVDDDRGVGFSNLNGASITGVTSGATADLNPTGYILSYGGSSKFIRIWDNAAGVGGNGVGDDVGLRASWTNGQFTSDGPVTNEVDTNLIPDEWNKFEVLIDMNTKEVTRRINSQVISQHTMDIVRSPLSEASNSGSPTVALFGIDGKQTQHLPEFGELYFDQTPQRLVIGDASTWAACTKTEIQLCSAWADNAITATLSFGEITGDKYLYAIDYSGEPVEVNGIYIGAAT